MIPLAKYLLGVPVCFLLLNIYWRTYLIYLFKYLFEVPFSFLLLNIYWEYLCFSILQYVNFVLSRRD